MRRSIPQGRQTTNPAGRRGGRFSTMVLLALLALTPVLALGLGPGWLMVQQRRSAAEQAPEAALAEEQAETALRQYGCIVMTDLQTGHVHYVSFRGRKDLDDATVQNLAALRQCTTLNLDDSGIADDQLRYVCDLPRLSCLALGGTEISDEGVASVADSLDLELLYLAGTNVTDESVPHITRMRNLVVLDLRNTRVTEEGLARLRSLPKLAELLYGDNRAAQQDSTRTQNVTSY